MDWLPRTRGQQIFVALVIAYVSSIAWCFISDPLIWLIAMVLLPPGACIVTTNPQFAADCIAHILLLPFRIKDAIFQAQLPAIPDVPGFLLHPQQQWRRWRRHRQGRRERRRQREFWEEFGAPQGHRAEAIFHCACLDGRAEQLERDLVRQRVGFADLRDEAREYWQQLQVEIDMRQARPRGGFAQQVEMMARIPALETELARARAELARAQAVTYELLTQHLGG